MAIGESTGVEPSARLRVGECPSRWPNQGNRSSRSAYSGCVSNVDADLFRACRDRDDGAAWAELVQRHTRRLLAIARNQGLDEASAADVVQTAWRNLFESMHQLREPERIGVWLTTAVKRNAQFVSKRSKRSFPHDPLDQMSPPVDEALLASERRAAVVRALGAIREQCRQLLVLLFAEDSPSYVAIAQQLSMPIGSIGPTRARCLEEMRRLLGSDPSYLLGSNAT
jgi:RNA polymerase sigma factor (sigma-70 family)